MPSSKASMLAEVDFVRTIAVFSVIMIHVSANYVESLALGFWLNQWSRFAVPLFLLLSGLVLNWSNQPSPSVISFYHKRFGKILLPYLLWTLFYLLFTAFTNRLPVAWSSLPGALIYGSAYYHLYFIIIILQLYLLYPFLKKWLANSARPCLIISLITTFACEVVLYLAMFGKIGLPHASSPIYLVAFPSWLFFFVLGMYLSSNYPAFKARITQSGYPIIALWGIAWVLFYLEGKYMGSYRSSIRLTTIPYTCASGLALIALPLLIHFPRVLQHAFAWAASQGFLIYLLHPAILAILLLRGRWLIPPATILSFIWLYLSTAAMTVLVSLILQRLPGIRFIGGVNRSRK